MAYQDYPKWPADMQTQQDTDKQPLELAYHRSSTLIRPRTGQSSAVTSQLQLEHPRDKK